MRAGEGGEDTNFYGGHGVEETEGIVVQQLPIGECSAGMLEEWCCIQPHLLATVWSALKTLTIWDIH